MMSIIEKYVSVSMLTTDSHGVLAQLGEHLPYKQRVIGSSPIGSIFNAIALRWRGSSVGKSTRFIPVVSLVRLQFPLLL